jgi:hypothetical protein
MLGDRRRDSEDRERGQLGELQLANGWSKADRLPCNPQPGSALSSWERSDGPAVASRRWTRHGNELAEIAVGAIVKPSRDPGDGPHYFVPASGYARMQEPPCGLIRVIGGLKLPDYVRRRRTIQVCAHGRTYRHGDTQRPVHRHELTTTLRHLGRT